MCFTNIFIIFSILEYMYEYVSLSTLSKYCWWLLSVYSFFDTTIAHFSCLLVEVITFSTGIIYHQYMKTEGKTSCFIYFFFFNYCYYDYGYQLTVCGMIIPFLLPLDAFTQSGLFNNYNQSAIFFSENLRVIFQQQYE